MVTGIAEGTTTITATSGDISVTYTLSVNPDLLVPSFNYENNFIYKLLTDVPFTNTLTNNSMELLHIAVQIQMCNSKYKYGRSNNSAEGTIQ